MGEINCFCNVIVRSLTFLAQLQKERCKEPINDKFYWKSTQQLLNVFERAVYMKRHEGGIVSKGHVGWLQ